VQRRVLSKSFAVADCTLQIGFAGKHEGKFVLSSNSLPLYADRRLLHSGRKCGAAAQPLGDHMKKTLAASLMALGLATGAAQAQPTTILNVSYDVGRELFAAVNEAFIPRYAEETGVTLEIDQSHAGTSKQARAIVEGLEADVVTFNQVTDIDLLVKNGFVAEGLGRPKFPNNASPFYSLPVLPRSRRQPEEHQGLVDLARDDVKVIFPNPKTSGNARYTYLAATAFAKEAFNGDEAKVEEFVTKLFDNVPVFDTGGRAATTTFVEREIGDVLITFEAEKPSHRQAISARTSSKASYPPSRLLAEFPVAIVDKVVDARAAASLQSPISISFTRQKARRSLPNSAIASMTRRSLPSSRTSSRKSAS
jgi:sulfate transport system substrate-binding protein